MNIHQLNIFTDVAHLGSFAEAAKRNDKDPSQISRIISQLENHVGVRLFQRSTRHLSLTEAGERFLSKITVILEQLEEATQQARTAQSSVNGKLVITASHAFGQQWLLPIVDEYLSLYPETSVDLRLTNKNIDLFDHQIDLACRLTPAFETDLVGIKLFDTRYLLCGSMQYLKVHGHPQSIKELSQHHIVVYDHKAYRTRWFFKDANNHMTQFNISSRFCVSSPLALLQCCLQDMGLVLLADWMAKPHLKAGKLINLLPQYHITATDFETAAWLLYPSKKYLAAKTRAMIELIKTHLS